MRLGTKGLNVLPLSSIPFLFNFFNVFSLLILQAMSDFIYSLIMTFFSLLIMDVINTLEGGLPSSYVCIGLLVLKNIY